MNPRVLRGRSLRRSAMRARSSAVCAASSGCASRPAAGAAASRSGWRARPRCRPRRRRSCQAQISARLQIEFPGDPMMHVSRDTIYRALYVQGRDELRRELARCLRTGGPPVGPAAAPRPGARRGDDQLPLTTLESGEPGAYQSTKIDWQRQRASTPSEGSTRRLTRRICSSPFHVQPGVATR